MTVSVRGQVYQEKEESSLRAEMNAHDIAPVALPASEASAEVWLSLHPLHAMQSALDCATIYPIDQSPEAKSVSANLQS